MPPLNKTTHAPLNKTTHAPPNKTTHAPPSNHAHPPGATMHAPPVNRMTNWCKNITLPQTSFAGSNEGFITAELETKTITITVFECRKKFQIKKKSNIFQILLIKLN